MYKCKTCGQTIEVLNKGEGKLICCGNLMEEQKIGEVDASKEKHVPVIEKISDGYVIKVGSETHPMTEKHYITFIEMIDVDNDIIQRKNLSFSDKPEATFFTKATKIIVREYCNLHGLWEAKNF